MKKTLITTLVAASCGFWLGQSFTQSLQPSLPITVPPPVTTVVCDSVWVTPVSSPSDPYRRGEVKGCTLGDVNGPQVEVVFID